MEPVDLDKVDTWPEEIVSFLEATATELRTERLADRAYTLTDTMHRLLNPLTAYASMGRSESPHHSSDGES
ncbi:hypothetical protein LB533_03475 [Mesorhizobium sp. BR1-1-13]|uniref:hypothetical protein n=1 Tax=Mesorhizobium sp. BR1-1-13 TaxID=2876656 RepID=UPI001CD1084B|nr:hypothetical protein [Mesorhizobium sp. BR1-1-13]MBZ9940160.1 hypothetical protein [Mesorhizobium sp. BR1-1-13]